MLPWVVFIVGIPSRGVCGLRLARKHDMYRRCAVTPTSRCCGWGADGHGLLVRGECVTGGPAAFSVGRILNASTNTRRNEDGRRYASTNERCASTNEGCASTNDRCRRGRSPVCVYQRAVRFYQRAVRAYQ